MLCSFIQGQQNSDESRVLDEIKLPVFLSQLYTVGKMFHCYPLLALEQHFPVEKKCQVHTFTCIIIWFYQSNVYCIFYLPLYKFSFDNVFSSICNQHLVEQKLILQLGIFKALKMSFLYIHLYQQVEWDGYTLQYWSLALLKMQNRCWDWNWLFLGLTVNWPQSCKFHQFLSASYRNLGCCSKELKFRRKKYSKMKILLIYIIKNLNIYTFLTMMASISAHWIWNF